MTRVRSTDAPPLSRAGWEGRCADGPSRRCRSRAPGSLWPGQSKPASQGDSCPPPVWCAVAAPKPEWPPAHRQPLAGCCASEVPASRINFGWLGTVKAGPVLLGRPCRCHSRSLLSPGSNGLCERRIIGASQSEKVGQVKGCVSEWKRCQGQEEARALLEFWPMHQAKHAQSAIPSWHTNQGSRADLQERPSHTAPF